MASSNRQKNCTSAKTMPNAVQEPTGTSGPSTATTKPKQMTLNRRLKKRESDRRCQRVSRERTKSRISYLEDLVEQLKEADASGQIASLLQRMTQLQEERDLFSSKLRSIENILLPASSSSRENTPKVVNKVDPPSAASLNYTGAATLPLPGDTMAARGSRFPCEPYTCSDFNVATPSVSDQHDYSDETFNAGQRAGYGLSQSSSSIPNVAILPSTPAPMTSPASGTRMCECGYAMSLRRQELNFWYLGNTTLSAWMRWPTSMPPISEDDSYHEDTPIRVVLQGWDAVEKRGNVHPMWWMMRGVDESLFASVCEPRERLGILYTVGLVLKAHIQPSKEQYAKIPAYYLTRSAILSSGEANA